MFPAGILSGSGGFSVWAGKSESTDALIHVKGEIVYDPSYRTENRDGLCDDLGYHHHQLFSGTYHAGRSGDPSGRPGRILLSA